MGKDRALVKERNKDRPVTSEGQQTTHSPAVKSDPTQLDQLIHERMRLGIISALAVNESLSFNELKKILKTTDGNLSVHARKLEEAEYILCKKSFDGRVPKTEFQLTQAGRKALERYLAHMEAIIQTMRSKE